MIPARKIPRAVCHEVAPWHWKDVALGILAVIALVGAYAVVALNDERTERTIREKRAAEDHAIREAKETYPGVRIIADEGAFICSPPTKIRTEWVDTISNSCKRLAAEMYAARATE